MNISDCLLFLAEKYKNKPWFKGVSFKNDKIIIFTNREITEKIPFKIKNYFIEIENLNPEWNFENLKKALLKKNTLEEDIEILKKAKILDEEGNLIERNLIE